MPRMSGRHRKIDELEREFHALLRRYDPMYKPEIIRVNISTPFLMRSRCKECGSAPNYYYYVRKPFLWLNARHQLTSSEYFRKWFKRMAADWYLESYPKYFNNLADFSFILDDKNYAPTLHRIRGVNIKDRENVTEFVGCECGASIWAFNQKSVQKRPEITNRKGRYKYPQRFVY